MRLSAPARSLQPGHPKIKRIDYIGRRLVVIRRHVRAREIEDGVRAFM
jgi:hypothetical protein